MLVDASIAIRLRSLHARLTPMEKQLERSYDDIRPLLSQIRKLIKDLSIDELFEYFKLELTATQILHGITNSIRDVAMAIEFDEPFILDRLRTRPDFFDLKRDPYIVEIFEVFFAEMGELLSDLIDLASSFEASTEHVAEVGSMRVSLETGPFTSTYSDKTLNDAINNTLEALNSIYRTYLQVGISSDVLEGPIILEHGFRYLPRHGTYNPINNKLFISLTDKKGSTLSADYYQDDSKEYKQIPTFFDIAHELAHRIYYRGLSDKSRQRWVKLYSRHTLSPLELDKIHWYHYLHITATNYEKYLEEAENLPPLSESLPEAVLNYHASQLTWLTSKVKEANKEANDYENSLPLKLRKFLSDYDEFFSEYEELPYFEGEYHNFSTIPWPTAKARMNEREAFAELLVATAWSDTFFDYAVLEVPPKELHRFQEIMRSFLSLET